QAAKGAIRLHNHKFVVCPTEYRSTLVGLEYLDIGSSRLRIHRSNPLLADELAESTAIAMSQGYRLHLAVEIEIQPDLHQN
nr:hypothetical protein [Tanacetum cinerariifolium]